MEPLKERDYLMLLEQSFYLSLIVYLGLYLGFYYLANLQYMIQQNAFTQSTYWVLTKTFPLLLFSISELTTIKTRFKKPYYLVAGTLIVILAVLRGGMTYLLSIGASWRCLTFQNVFGFRQHYTPIIEYLVFSLIYFELFDRKISNHFNSFTYSLLALSVVGLLYELPVFHKETMFYHTTYPFIIHPRWIMLPLICQKIGFKAFTHPLLLLAFTGWLLFSIYYSLNPNQPTWLPRLPTLLFWLTPITVMGRKTHVSV